MATKNLGEKYSSSETDSTLASFLCIYSIANKRLLVYELHLAFNPATAKELLHGQVQSSPYTAHAQLSGF